MHLLGFPELLELLNLGVHWIGFVEFALLLQHFFNLRQVLFILVEYARAILGAHIEPLLIELRGIVFGKEAPEEICKTEDFRIVGHIDHFCVIRGPGADELIAGVVKVAPTIAHGGIGDSL